MWREIQILFWLQWKLTLAMFRSPHLSQRWRAFFIIWDFFRFFSAPARLTFEFALMYLIFSSLTPLAALEAAFFLNGFYFIGSFISTSGRTKLVGEIDIRPLLIYPISFRGLAIGKVFASLFTRDELSLSMVLLGQTVGLARHFPAAIPALALNAFICFFILALTRIVVNGLWELLITFLPIRTFFKILASLLLIAMPLAIKLIGLRTIVNYVPPVSFINWQQSIRYLLRSPSIEAFWNGLGRLIEKENPSAWLQWLPANWGMKAVIFSQQGTWLHAFLWLTASMLWIGALYWFLMKLMRKQIQIFAEKAEISNSSEKPLWQFQFPKPAIFWALVNKTWKLIFRDPSKSSLFFLSIVLCILFNFILWLPVLDDPQQQLRYIRPLSLISLFMAVPLHIIWVSIIFDNHYVSLECEGFTTLALAPVQPLMILIATDTAIWLAGSLHAIILSIMLFAFTKSWLILVIAILCCLLINMWLTPLNNLISMVLPYPNNHPTSQKIMLIHMVLLTRALPVFLLLYLPLVFWKPALWVTIPTSLCFVVGQYALTLWPLASILRASFHSIRETINIQEKIG